VAASTKAEVGKTSYFLAVCIDTWKTVRDMTKVTTNDLRKLHMHFRLAQRSMTLNCYRFKFSWNSALLCTAFLGGNNGEMNEDRPALSATELLHTESTF